MSPEQSKPAVRDVPPHWYGTPTALSAIAAARSPMVGFGAGVARFRGCWLAEKLTAAAALCAPPGMVVPLPSGIEPAQPSTLAASANASNKLRRRLGIERG